MAALWKAKSGWPDTRLLTGERQPALWFDSTHGPARFSDEDETTMGALGFALGELTPRFSVIGPDATLVRDGDADRERNEEPWWADLLRLASGMPSKGKEGQPWQSST